jgi:hypothetical protein
MDTSSSPDRVSQSDLVEGIKVIDVDTHLSEPLDLSTPSRSITACRT